MALEYELFQVQFVKCPHIIKTIIIDAIISSIIYYYETDSNSLKSQPQNPEFNVIT